MNKSQINLQYKPLMEAIKNPFYYDIEISACSDAEDLEIITNKRPTQTEQTTGKSKKPKLNRGKKNEIYIKGNTLIRSRIKTLDLSCVLDELTKIMSEYKRNMKFYEGKGTPLSILQVVDFLHEQLVLGKTEIDSKKKKAFSKELNQIKKSVSSAFKDFEEEIATAKTATDFSKLEEMNDEIEGEEETAEVGQTVEGTGAVIVKQHTVHRHVEEEEVVDFNKRLTMNKEDRRKFWLLSKKVEKTDHERKIERGPRQANKQKRVVQVKKPTGQEINQFEHFNLSVENLKNFVKEIYSRRSGFDMESLSQDLEKLNYALENVSEASTKAELLMLIIYLQIELARESTMPATELLEACLCNLKQLMEFLRDEQVVIQNHNKDESRNYTHSELLRQFNGYVNQVTEELDFSLKLTDPFDQQLPERLAQETEFVEFLFSYQELLASLDEQKVGLTHIEVCAKIIQFIHHISDDFVLNCEILSDIFENESISQTVKNYANIIYQKSSNQKLLAKVKLSHTFNVAINLKNLGEANALMVSTQRLACHISSDKNLTALFNRTLAQMGIASFKQNNFEKCKFYLFELLSAENTEVLLSQFSVASENAIDLPDPMSVFPYHMHINLEEARAAFLIASVLTESAKTVLYQDNLQFCGANKCFVKFLESHHSSMFVNSPANVFDRIFSFYRKIVQFDAVAAMAQIEDVKYFSGIEGFEEFVTKQAKLECLNCYLEKLKNDPKNAFSISDFSNLFGIEKNELVRILEAKINEGNLQAKIDISKDTIFINNALGSILKGDREFDILESLKYFAQLNQKLKSTKDKSEGKKGSKVFDISSFIARKFDNQEKNFNFTYDYAFFKRQVG